MKYDFVVIDFEIANNNFDSACSIGLIMVKDNVIVDNFYSLIKPEPLEFDPETIKVHKIHPNDVLNSPTFDVVWNQIQTYFDENIILAHNAQFDMNVLRHCLDKYNLTAPNFTYICTIPLSTKVCSGQGLSNKLSDRCEFLGISLSNHHNALCDAEATANLILKCIEIKKVKNFEAYCRRYPSLPIKDFYNLKVQKSFNPTRTRFKKIDIASIVPENCNTIPNYFSNKNIVFTGTLLTIDKKVAMQKVVNLGATLKSGVSKKVNILVVGLQDKKIVGEDGISSKERKALDINSKTPQIDILHEEEFIKKLTEVGGL